MGLSKYSIGIGDRFGHQGKAQLDALITAGKQGIEITPVWNKSYREHKTIGSLPTDTRITADRAVQSMNWTKLYFIDADHISLKTVDGFLHFSDFFTMDVADEIGKPVAAVKIREFIQFCERFTRPFKITGIDEEIAVDHSVVGKRANQYLAGVLEAKKIYQHIMAQRPTPFVLELSIDETEYPQLPIDLFFILAAAAWCRLPLDTIAPKFTGRFNKGVDYVGDIEQFAREFEKDVLVVKFAIQEFGLPSNLKLSVHSGSDKFSIYPIIRKVLKKYNVGVHLKTAGTTWLEEVIGIASVGGDGLILAKEIYSQAYHRKDELMKPYATVLDIDPDRLPVPGVVNAWKSDEFVNSLRHIQSERLYNPDFRQLLHVGYKIAVEMGLDYQNALVLYEEYVAPNVTENIYSRHIVPLFIA
ncbi:tagaturonate epimerase family protein [bacterium]|nr:tagaturonate epimerase family protein [bacterium]MBU1065410.1 tagaturonate epimerase family protein [bacterium]MBU1635962.1 tagaturonate epimerase family protein [bacterium]MBU1875293.1 tagaturonate epimerase family protein [bacterium]